MSPEKDLGRHVQASARQPAPEAPPSAAVLVEVRNELFRALVQAANALETALPYLLRRGELSGGPRERAQDAQQVRFAIERARRLTQ